MFACCSDAASRISRSNRVGGHRRRELGREHLHDDLAAEAVLVGENTRDMPPPPSSRSRVYVTGERLSEGGLGDPTWRMCGGCERGRNVGPGAEDRHQTVARVVIPRYVARSLEARVSPSAHEFAAPSCRVI